MRQCEALAQACGLHWNLTIGDTLPEVEPALILSFGRGLAQAIQLKKIFGDRPALVQLGRPRLVPPSQLDLIILMPQDDFPSEPNVMQLQMPLNGADAAHTVVKPLSGAEHGTVSVLLGGPTRHFSFTPHDLTDLLNRAERLAGGTGQSLHVVPGPRTPDTLVDLLEKRYIFSPQVINRDPLHKILQKKGRLVVTADSASLVADAWRSGNPTWIYPLPPKYPPIQRLKIMADRLSPEIRHTLIRRGWLAGGTDFLRWYRMLAQKGLIRPLTEQGLQNPHWHMRHDARDKELLDCRDRTMAVFARREGRT
ncbi:nucleoside-diphosphate sugar epimerase [Acetobacter sp. LMG 1627]|uniref:Nucleoside-diphosphate sugar epimerase n=2 Tax=Acetobacter conturbans TaxID=1737472 RepID=A0ABX0K5F2_9PROT|nr:ELM1/GtrOC1 family putative glycosyltransferase [Acetobacter conturbans]NHN89583.1 nucleoside-diphosphate sugar epimerase [Acetobacter conturbans]